MNQSKLAPLPSAAEQQLMERFTKHSTEFTTFLQLPSHHHGHSTGNKDQDAQPVSTITELEQGFNNSEICSRYDTSPEEFFLSAYILTLRRYIGQDSLSFCIIPINHNTILPLAIQLSMDMDLHEFFQFVKKELNFLKTCKNHDFTELSLLPFYTHGFAYNTDISSKANPNPTFGLQVTEISGDAKIQVSLTWEKSQLEPQVAKLFLVNFINCCKILATTNSSTTPTTLKNIDIMCQEEKDFLASFQRSNPSNDPSPTDSIISIFDQNYLLNPEKIAIHETSAQYTYSQLWMASCDIATQLREQFSPQQLTTFPIVLVMEKNFTCIAAVLGVWRAGGHFLPVDGNLQENLIRLLASGAVSSPLCILTNLESQQLIFAQEGQTIIQIKDLLSKNCKFPTQTEETTNVSDRPAYITTTSGSTGQPKKCILSTGGLLQFISSAKTEFDLSPSTNILQWVSFSFDVFISDVIKGLFCTAGSLTLVSSLERLDVSKIAQLVSQRGVNIIQMTPQFALFACQEAEERGLINLMNGVQTLALGGESLPWKTVQLLKKYLDPGTKIYNCYGLTETTIESTVFLLPIEEVESNYYQKLCRYVPIGRPLVGIRVEVVDPITLLPSPIGVSGRVSISGVTVGSGDFSTNSDTFLSGDTASWLSNGVLQFRERDGSVILKAGGGLRINTAELESQVMHVAGSGVLNLPVDLAVALTIAIDEEKEILAMVLKMTSNDTLTTKDGQALLVELKKQLPYYMVPQFVTSHPKFPTTQNGKIDRKGLALEVTEAYRKLHSTPRSTHDNEDKATADEMTATENYLLQKLISISGSQFSTKTNTTPFRDLGLTSFQLMSFANILLAEKTSNFDGIVDIFTYPTIQLLAAKIDSNTTSNSPNNVQIPNHPPSSLSDPDPICIVGMSFRLPGNFSGSIPDFWSTLSAGTCFVRPMPESRSDQVLTRMTTPFTSSCVPASFFDSIDLFDHEFFRIAPSEAKHMCPEQRFFLEISTEALVDAGYNLSTIEGSNIAVYATASEVEYGLIDPSLEGVAVVGRQSSVVPSRLSYTYNLRGGNYVVDTACSAALTALEQAVRDLRAGSTDAAVVGGVNIYLYPAKDGLMGTNLIHSPNSTCLPFDDRADGTASGEGAFSYVLKQTSAAQRDGNYIYGTIESVTSNAVGRGNGITAPSVDSQVRVIQSALTQAGIGIDQLDFLETHGTGTILGDQIELCALNTVFTPRTNPQRLTLGATKQQYGHLDMSAAFLGMLKATCALTFNSSPKMRHIQKPSKYLDQSLFQTDNEQLVDWSQANKAYAGVSAYGLSGTNCHSVISVQKPNSSAKSTNSENEICQFLIPLQERRITFEAICGSYSSYAQFYLDLAKSNNATPNVTLQNMCGTQVMNLINANTDPNKIQEVAVLSAKSLDELIKKLTALEEGITVLSTDQIQKLDSPGFLKYLPQGEFNRVPALPKFLYKKFSHWLPPVDQKEQLKPLHRVEITNNNNPGLLVAKLQSQLAKKSKEIQKLVDAAHKLERMVHQFSIGLLTDLPMMTSDKILSSDSEDEDYLTMSPSPKLSFSSENEEEEIMPIHHHQEEELTYETTFQKVCKIWQDCLGCEDIAASDIFRDLGGDSLLTVQMTKIISKTFGIKVKAADAFSNPTLASFTSLVFISLLNLEGNKKPDEGILLPLNSPKWAGMPLKMILFPGQGSQKVEMFQSLSTCPAAAPIFAEAQQITGMDLISLSQNPESFQNTEFVQVALFVGSLAKIAQLRATDPESLLELRAVGGLSVGEFAALVFAEAITFRDALQIVQYRGKVMQLEVESSSTGMVSIFGPDAATFTTWLEDNKEDFAELEFCTYLATNQFTIGGPLQVCQKLVDLLAKDEKLAGRLGIIDARLLRVAGAFHTRYMSQAGIKTAAMIDNLDISFPKYAVVMNFDGQVAMNKESIRFNLKKQTSCPVMWKESMMTAFEELGIRKFVEISPSSVLTPILKNRIKGISNVETTLIRF